MLLEFLQMWPKYIKACMMSIWKPDWIEVFTITACRKSFLVLDLELSLLVPFLKLGQTQGINTYILVARTRTKTKTTTSLLFGLKLRTMTKTELFSELELTLSSLKIGELRHLYEIHGPLNHRYPVQNIHIPDISLYPHLQLVFHML